MMIAETKAPMACPACSNASKRFGKHRNGLQRYRCLGCAKTFTEDHQAAFRIEDYLKRPEGLMALNMLLEGTSIRTAERITGIHRDTIIRLMIVAGERCEKHMDSIRNVAAKDVEADEQWCFVGKKDRNLKEDEKNNPQLGSQWVWIAMEANSKLVLAFTLGQRTEMRAAELMFKVGEAISRDSRFQLTADGFPGYRGAVKDMLGDRCDFAQLVKTYARPQKADSRYSPPELVCAVPVPRMGRPEIDRVCTSHVERLNLTNRMQVRRLTRLTNAFSRKFENLRAMLALHFAYYNWCKLHRSIRVTPAMEAGITDHVWTLAELLF